MEQTVPQRYTVKEYFALEKQSEARHEFIDGELFMMAGANVPSTLR